MITVITRWESSQMPEQVEWQIWRQLKGAFHVDRLIFIPRVHKMEGYTFDQADDVYSALKMLATDTRRIFLEPNGAYDIDNLWPPRNQEQDVAFILGNTQSGNMKFARNKEETVRIDTIGSTDLYGINAAAIALHEWRKK